MTPRMRGTGGQAPQGAQRRMDVLDGISLLFLFGDHLISFVETHAFKRGRKRRSHQRCESFLVLMIFLLYNIDLSIYFHYIYIYL